MSGLTDLMTMARPSEELKTRIAALAAREPDMCLQCGRCTSGCTAFKLLELKPHEIVCSVKMGFVEELVSSKAIWDCALCLKCAERCPQAVSPYELILALRNEAVLKGLEMPEGLREALMSIMETGLALRPRKAVDKEGRVYGREELGLPELRTGLPEQALTALMDMMGGA